MALNHTEKYRKRLIDLLEDLFQLNQPDLDFGFYKIMHAKAQTVRGFIQNDLLEIIKNTLGKMDESTLEQARLRYEHAVEQAKSFGAPDPQAAPAVQQARAVYDAAKNTGESEAQIYEHLYRFFERYYDNGDFMSRRYFARESASIAAPYAVPYDGREVYLHWANRDQYYIKTSEYLTNFTFDIARHFTEAERTIYNMPDRLKLHCRIVDAAEGEHNNNKAATERFFLIHTPAAVIDENGELVLQFEYRPDKAKQGTAAKWQEMRIIDAERAIFGALEKLGERAEPYKNALEREIGEDKNKRTLLRKYLTKYTRRNQADYFIHKDLSGFLRRELDFYIKNEMMRLDDIEGADAPQVQEYLDKIKVLRKIGGQLIALLAQLEEFQKKLWLKKKFVTETQYCLTLDRVPQAFYPEIAANGAQRKEWVKLFAIEEREGYSEPLREDFLKANPFLVLDTAFFPSRFKDAVVASIDNLDETLDGLLIHSENFQALELMQEKYRQQVKCIYIDPPYNTGNDGFIYKDNCPHSSWLSMMENRLIEAKETLRDDGVIFISIDDNEQARLKELCDKVFGEENFIGQIVAQTNPRGRQLDKHLAKTFEYIVLYSKNLYESVILQVPKTEKTLKEYNQKDEIGCYRLLELRNRGSSQFNRLTRPNLFFPIYINPNTKKVSLNQNQEFNEVAFPINSKNEDGCWTWGRDKVKNENSLLVGKKTRDGGWRVFRKDYIPKDGATSKEKSLWLDKGVNHENGKELVSSLFGSSVFDFPKSTEIIVKALRIGTKKELLVLDYFAGSGTTGHAVVNLNREDGGRRKYIMVEMGAHFDAVLKPRMQKVVYSQSWKDGKPVSQGGQFNGISHAFKTIRLESYEDTLNNLAFQSDAAAKKRQDALDKNAGFRREYMLKYWLEFETRGSPSLLNIAQFDDPTAYKLKIKKSDEYQEKAVDLAESFNYLIGLHVEHLGAWRRFCGSFRRDPDPELPKDQDTRLILDGAMIETAQETADGAWLFRSVIGRVCRTPGDMKSTERMLVIWRKLTGNLEQDNVMLDEYFTQHCAQYRAQGIDVIYVNASGNLADLRRDDEHREVRLIEAAFHQKMWDGQG